MLIKFNPIKQITTIKVEPQKGFTLIEILIVLVIISITSTFAMLAFGDFGAKRRVINNAYHLADYIKLVEKESILEATTLAIRIKNNRYDVLHTQNSNTWTPMTQRLFHNQQFSKNCNVTLYTNNNKNLIFINPSGDISPFKLFFAMGKNTIVAIITGYANGNLKVEIL
jgi:general secretion pathway protein H